MEVILYHTEGCHLCEDAIVLYQQLGLKTTLTVEDIAFDDNLFKRYSVTIPVISLQKSSTTKEREVVDELCWPFDLAKLKSWIENYGIN